MTIRELYERALAEGKADMTVVFPNRDYEYGYQPYILATGIEDPIKNKYNAGLIVITGTQEIGQEDTEDSESIFDYMDEESEDNYAQYKDFVYNWVCDETTEETFAQTHQEYSEYWETHADNYDDFIDFVIDYGYINYNGEREYPPCFGEWITYYSES